MTTARDRALVAAALLSPVVTFPLGLAIGHRWVLPLLNTLPAYAAMAWLLARGRRRAAVGFVLGWAVALGLAGTLALAAWPTPPDAAVLNGPAYRDEMFAWIRTGEGREGDWRAFLPQHVGHLLAFVALSLVSASALSIFMGAVLMAYMSFYVASLARAGVPAGTVVVFGWQPWAVARVFAFCILGAVLAEPLLARLRGRKWDGWPAVRPYVLAAAAGILADWVLKATLAPAWGRILRDALP
jgi:hypothetical protein